MDDLFYREQMILENAKKYLTELDGAECCGTEEFKRLTDEYAGLLKQLRRFMKLSDRTTEGLNSSNMELLDKVRYDALTGVFSRRYLEENLRRVLRNAVNMGDSLSVMVIDVDFFKRFNDTYGHDKGDECLKKVAKAINAGLCRPDDFVARYGGEEFVVVLQRVDEEGARRLSDRLLENVRACNINHEHNRPYGRVTVSIGVTSMVPEHKNTAQDFIRRADKAMYASKAGGRNRYTFLEFYEREAVKAVEA